MIDLDSKKLKDINKPARYVGGEVNIVTKDSNVKTSIVLCYPNIYEKAMSNYIVNLLYNNLNNINHVWCKRCFAVETDFEELLRETNTALYSLEDFKPVKDNDMLLFVIDNELDFTIFLTMLDLAKIPIDKALRTEEQPKIVVIPTNNINTNGIARFADYILKYNSEKEALQRLLKYVQKNKQLSFENFDIETNEFEAIDIKLIKNNVIPSIKINNSSIIIDVLNIKNEDLIIDYISSEIKATGTNKISFINQDKIDELKFCELIYKIKMNIEGIRILSKNIDFNSFKPEILVVLLPCLEPSTVNFNVITCSKKIINKTSMGTEKDILIERVKKVFKNNRNSINLVFNIGLPEETYEDIDSIFDVAHEIVNLYSKNKAKDKFSMKLTLNYFIPNKKDNINLNISNINKLETKIMYIKEKTLDDIIKLEIEDLSTYMKKAILKNGDENVSDIVYKAYKQITDSNLNNKKNNKYLWDKIIFDNIRKGE